MPMRTWKECVPCLTTWGWICLASVSVSSAQVDAPLPAGVKAVWDMDKACHETTPTRERISINGLWRWQPSATGTDRVPAGNWGYFKVPGRWPGYVDYAHRESQMLFAHPRWKERERIDVGTAWYQREIAIPQAWAGRRIVLAADYVNSLARVFVDGKTAGELRFPGGELEITSLCRPGQVHVLSVLVAAMPLSAVTARPVNEPLNTMSGSRYLGKVLLKGLCGDVYLTGVPAGPRLADFKIATSTRSGTIALDAAIEDLAADGQYTLSASIDDRGREVASLKSPPFRDLDLSRGRMSFTLKWLPEKLWNVHTPQHTYRACLSLLDASGKVLDTAVPERFGFREFWIDGRDFYINGARIQLCVVPFSNCGLGAAWASYDGAKETMLRLMTFGVNCIYTHNYGCAPGDHLSYEEVMRAADDVGMLLSLSIPNAGPYDWKSPGADEKNGYAPHAAFYTRAAANHPSVVFYSMHYATPYTDDMNPDMIDGIQGGAGQRDVRGPLAIRAEAIVKRMDPTRVIYHHAGGNLGAMHTSNFYANFAPSQEMCDWFEHWATKGVKPLFTCEYGVPFSWDWAMFRGWLKGNRYYGGVWAPWEFCLAEWNAQFFGDSAFRISDREKANLRFEARMLKANNAAYQRWNYPHQLGANEFDERQPVFAAYFTDNWRAFRTWGVSAISPWEHNVFWKQRPAVSMDRKSLPTDWDHLQRPGFSADYVEPWYEIRRDIFYDRSDWLATPAADALTRNGQPLLACLGGRPAHFTSKDHNFLPGETVEKQLIILNNHRETVRCDCRWSLGLPQPVTGTKTVSLGAGQQARIPLSLMIPAGTAPGRCELSATVRFDQAPEQSDTFIIHVLPLPEQPKAARVALFDPQGETGKLLAALGVKCQTVEAGTALGHFDLLVIGKGAITPDGPAPDLAAVRDGLKVLVFEQTKEAMERRLGFRVAEYGLRQVFARVPDHPILEGLDADHLRDWRGEATLVPPRLKYQNSKKYAGDPAIKWCDVLEVPQVWRVGNWGNVASVLPEKPARGDFLPLVDGGYSLQYGPLMEFREGRGMVLFCQLDVTGRTDNDPVAARLAGRMIDYACAWKPGPVRQIVYVGEAAGKKHLQQAGFSPADYDSGSLTGDKILVVGPHGGRKLAADKQAVADWLRAGGNLLALGLDQDDADAFLPLKVTVKKGEHIAACFDRFGLGSPLVGVGPADVHNRDPRELPLVVAGATCFGDGVLAERANLVFCQMPPWQFPYSAPNNTKRTFRRTAYMLTRLLGNLGAAASTPLLSRFAAPAPTDEANEANLVDALWLQAGDQEIALPLKWKGTTAPGGSRLPAGWTESRFDDSGWRECRVPGHPLAQFPGTVRFSYEGPFLCRVRFQVPADLAGAEATLHLGMIGFEDWTYVNGKQVGSINQQTHPDRHRSMWRVYPVPAGLLRGGENVVAVRINFVWRGECGILGYEPRQPQQIQRLSPVKRCLSGLYLDVPEEWDYPYRFMRW